MRAAPTGTQPAPVRRAREAGAAGAPIGLAPLEALVGFNIHIVDLLMYQRFYERFGAAMTPGIFSTLLAIRVNPGVRHGALADALMIRRPNMTKLVNRLVRNGHVTRQSAAGDQRSIVLHLTARGERALDRMHAAMPAHEAGLASALSANERASLQALLRKLAASLCAPPRGNARPRHRAVGPGNI